GKPQVVYREVVTAPVTGEAVFDREISGKFHYAKVIIQLSPLDRGAGISFVNKAPEAQVPSQFAAAIEQGIRESLEGGYLKGYPVVDVGIVLQGGGFEEGKSTELGFSVCASMACKDALENAAMALLEPIMQVEMFVPDTYMGDAIADLNARGGKVESIAAKSGIQIIHAVVPLAKMFGFSTALRSATQGRGTFSMKFDRFDRV
ncbi:MAG TPA: elongation factor G, partial [Desulfotignum sp.]|nr:elongation factor G [Desulfotignum sp.]